MVAGGRHEDVGDGAGGWAGSSQGGDQTQRTRFGAGPFFSAAGKVGRYARQHPETNLACIVCQARGKEEAIVHTVTTAVLTPF